MRKLILTKDTEWITKLGLEGYVLKPSHFISSHFCPPIMGKSGRMYVPKAFDEDVVIHLYNAFKRGSLIILNIGEHAFEWVHHVIDLALEYRYSMYWAGTPCNVVNDRGVHFLPSVGEIEKELETPIEDFSDYRKIHHFGDLHGCFSVLREYFNRFPFQDDELYIFLGDYVDRGIEHCDLIPSLLNFSQLDNVIMLQGNHDRHLWSWATGREFEGGWDFIEYTQKELGRSDIDREAVAQFFESLEEIVVYQYGDKRVLVTHGGLSAIPSRASLVPSRQLTNGVGTYQTRIDLVFHRNTEKHEFQIHGHRNIRNEGVKVTERTFNLEGGIEYGGDLRVVILDHKGFHPYRFANHIFDSYFSGFPSYLYGEVVAMSGRKGESKQAKTKTTRKRNRSKNSDGRSRRSR